MNALQVTLVCFQIIAGCLGIILFPKKFPEKFLFGAHTAAFGIEGGWNADGKGQSLLDFFVHRRPEIFETNHGGNVTAQAEVAADSYHKFKEDIRITKELGLDFYRFSISWPRLFPLGYANNINQAGVDYYKQVLDEVIAANITPVVVLFHYDYPSTGHIHFGGFSNEMGIQAFTAYADSVFGLFGDRVKHWMTINAPYKFCKEILGETIASRFEYFPTGQYEYLCGHNILKAHAKVYRLYQSKYKKSPEDTVSISFILNWYEPASTKSEDIEAAHRAMDFHLGWFMDPLIYGNYPGRMIKTIAEVSRKQNYTFSRLPQFTADEIKEIKGTTDFVILIPVATYLVSHNDEIRYPPTASNDVQITTRVKDEWRDENSLDVNTVWGFRNAIKYVWDVYSHPRISIAQGYGALKDSLHDTYRIEFMKRYLDQVLQLIYVDKVDINHYSVWSLIDLFNFQLGYKATYGLAQVDYNDPSRPRVIRASGKYYRDVIKSRKIYNR